MGPDLSVATDHHCRTVPSGRRDRHCLAHARRRHEGTARSDLLVENVTGASGTIGSGRVVRAEPDGYTLVIGQWSSHVGAGALYRLPYHVLHDFEPISVLTTSPLWILGKNDLPAKDLKELIAWLKANPDKRSEERRVGKACHYGGRHALT